MMRSLVQTPQTSTNLPASMQLGGIDPGIIRELSGIYKPFVKAFKELISNAYDADATTIHVVLSDDFGSIEVLDDGNGMTPYEFHESFARLGSSAAWQKNGTSPGGRPRIGYKGIGFLAVARYCSALHLETHCRFPYKGGKAILRRNRKVIPLRHIVGEIIPIDLVEGRVKITTVWMVSDSGKIRLRPGSDYRFDDKAVRLIGACACEAKRLQFDFAVDCKGLKLKAVLDFEYLLGLERQADLRLLDNFYSVELSEISPQAESHTSVRLQRLKEFVVRDLSAPRGRGKGWNVVSKSGKERFLWQLARSAPIRDVVPEETTCEPIRRLSELQTAAKLPSLVIKWCNDEPVTLARPIYLALGQKTPLYEGVVPVDLDQDGLRVIGYLLARGEVIYPAEFRGISIRVRHVAIGDASFLGWERILSGHRKVALGQITGELLVTSGLDATDSINPGRESFYEENRHFRLLQHALFGSEESIGGLVGRALRYILERVQVRSNLVGALRAARERRKALVEVSSAVNFYCRNQGEPGEALKSFFESQVYGNGLALARDARLRPEHSLAGFKLEQAKSTSEEGFQIDYRNHRIWIDFERDAWSTNVYLLGHYYDVLIKQGKPDQPICEFDNQKRHIYVNWGHPVKLHMGESAFLKSAILLRLAHHAVPKDGDAMMELALNMLSFRAE